MFLFRNFHEFFGFGAADGADEVGGEFFTFYGENTVVTGIFLHNDRSFYAWHLLQRPVKVSWQPST